MWTTGRWCYLHSIRCFLFIFCFFLKTLLLEWFIRQTSSNPEYVPWNFFLFLFNYVLFVWKLCLLENFVYRPNVFLFNSENLFPFFFLFFFCCLCFVKIIWRQSDRQSLHALALIFWCFSKNININCNMCKNRRTSLVPVLEIVVISLLYLLSTKLYPNTLGPLNESVFPFILTKSILSTEK